MQVESQVAGYFYPNDPNTLSKQIDDFLLNTEIEKNNIIPKAIIVPHAGYIYSGQTAAFSYNCLEKIKNKIKKVVIIGPAHRVGFNGIAGTLATEFVTPLGVVKVDESSMENVLTMPSVMILEEAFQGEHCLEVQLPFLQKILNNFTIVPLIVGNVSYITLSEVIERLWGFDDTLFVISSDLSHYHDYKTAQNMDSTTANAIVNLEPDNITYDNACGRIGIQAMLDIAKSKNMTVKQLDLRNSGDTAGDKNRVVGYGAFCVYG